MQQAKDRDHAVDMADLQIAHNQFSDLKAQCQYQAGVVDTLRKQNGDQQNLIDNCQTQAIQMLAPPDLKIETVMYGLPNASYLGKPAVVLQVVGLTNKVISPIDVVLRCSDQITVIGGIFMGVGGGYTGPNVTRIDAKAYRLQLESPAWTPIRPLGIAVAMDASKINPACKITRN
jgi:hypothetical protein